MLTLWSIVRSPLILGANLTELDDWTIKLITNRDVLDMDQFGHDQGQVVREGDAVAWISEGKGENRYLALFNLGDKEQAISRNYGSYHLPAKTYRSRELWTHTDRGRSDEVQLVIPAHGCVLLELRP